MQIHFMKVVRVNIGQACFTTMANFYLCRFFCLSLVVFVAVSSTTAEEEDDRQVYIVYMGNLVEGDESPSSYHFNMLREIVDSRFVGQSLVRSYRRSFNGFAAYLTDEERDKLANHAEVVSVFPSKTYYPQTTRSWDFMGFTQHVHRNPTIESDIIIGVIDTGLWPYSKSFDDRGFGPPPKKWKGDCKGGKNFTCNNKVIGARYYNSQSAPDNSAIDNIGHGTHAASIAAGNYVKDASFYGIAGGTARGGAPSARIVAYKVCYEKTGCDSTDILAAFDDAIADGVDIITISISYQMALEFAEDSVAIGALHASQRGILVVQSAGNFQKKKAISSVAPWVLSVAASNSDREIITKVVLGDGNVLSGKSVNSFSMNGTSYPLVYGKDISPKCDEEAAQYCDVECLEPSLVKEKIVLCNTFTGMIEAYRIGALGSIALADFFSDASVVLPFAATSLHDQDFHLLQTYFSSTKFPKVEILTTESVTDRHTPVVADFSSKGPNIIIPDILKPDITAPGVDILAAFSPVASPSNNPSDKRSVNFNVLFGTSMSCPHVAGAAAYVKSLHPNWSPCAIKSALMTTAWRMDPIKNPLAEFAYGAGHIDPTNAANPGLVYETQPEDYVEILGSLGYDSAKLRKIFGVVNSTCITHGVFTPKDLNYPSMSVRVITTNANNNVSSSTFSEKFTRTVTNVGFPNSTYKARTRRSPDYYIQVEPSILTFGALNEKKSFEVTISGKIDVEKMVSASLEWFDGFHTVRSPIVVYSDDI